MDHVGIPSNVKKLTELIEPIALRRGRVERFLSLVNPALLVDVRTVPALSPFPLPCSYAFSNVLVWYAGSHGYPL